jgi:hypothetical protein
MCLIDRSISSRDITCFSRKQVVLLSVSNQLNYKIVAGNNRKSVNTDMCPSSTDTRSNLPPD